MRFFKEPKVVFAHCDIPCGIYDPHEAQVAALTVIRMVDLLGESQSSHDETRYISAKEEHAKKCKEEVRIIWGDYFKEEHLAKYPDLSGLVHDIMSLGSKVKQKSDKKTALELLDKVNRFAEVFWESKGVETKRVKAPYEPGEQIVQPVL